MKRFIFRQENEWAAKPKAGVRRKTAELLDALQISRISSLEDTQISSNSTRLTYIIKLGSDCISVYQKRPARVE
jgi:hypothetical protein